MSRHHPNFRMQNRCLHTDCLATSRRQLSTIFVLNNPTLYRTNLQIDGNRNVEVIMFQISWISQFSQGFQKYTHRISNLNAFYSILSSYIACIFRCRISKPKITLLDTSNYIQSDSRLQFFSYNWIKYVRFFWKPGAIFSGYESL